MKSFFTFLFITLIFCGLQGQEKKYSLLEGKIGQYPVLMQLFETKNQESEEFYFTGDYWYPSQEIPISISQEPADNPQTLLMLTWSEDESQQEFFSGTFSNGIYKGTWTKGDKELPFELKITSAGSSISYYEAQRKASLKAGDEEIA